MLIPEASTPWERLYWAILLGDKEQIRAQLGSPELLNAVDADGRTLLTITIDREAECKEYEITEMLLLAGADSNLPGYRGWLPLSSAAFGANIALVEVLLRAGADPHKAGENGNTALMDACKVGSIPVAQALLQAGADANATDHLGSTALTWAVVRTDEPRLVRLLLQAGANRESRDAYGRTPLAAACAIGHIQSVRALLQAGAAVNVADLSGNTPLIEAARQASTEIIHELLAMGADRERRNQEGLTARMITTNPEVRMLLDSP